MLPFSRFELSLNRVSVTRPDSLLLNCPLDGEAYGLTVGAATFLETDPHVTRDREMTASIEEHESRKMHLTVGYRLTRSAILSRYGVSGNPGVVHSAASVN